MYSLVLLVLNQNEKKETKNQKEKKRQEIFDNYFIEKT